MNGYGNRRVEALLDTAPALGFTEIDFEDLCVAAADQAMCTEVEQRAIRAILDAAAARRDRVAQVRQVAPLRGRSAGGAR